MELLSYSPFLYSSIALLIFTASFLFSMELFGSFLKGGTIRRVRAFRIMYFSFVVASFVSMSISLQVGYINSNQPFVIPVVAFFFIILETRLRFSKRHLSLKAFETNLINRSIWLLIWYIPLSMSLILIYS